MEEAGEGRVAAYGGGGDGVGCTYSTTRGETIERCRVGAASFLKGEPLGEVMGRRKKRMNGKSVVKK